MSRESLLDLRTIVRNFKGKNEEEVKSLEDFIEAKKKEESSRFNIDQTDDIKRETALQIISAKFVELVTNTPDQKDQITLHLKAIKILVDNGAKVDGRGRLSYDESAQDCVAELWELAEKKAEGKKNMALKKWATDLANVLNKEPCATISGGKSDKLAPHDKNCIFQ